MKGALSRWRCGDGVPAPDLGLHLEGLAGHFPLGTGPDCLSDAALDPGLVLILVLHRLDSTVHAGLDAQGPARTLGTPPTSGVIPVGA